MTMVTNTVRCRVSWNRLSAVMITILRLCATTNPFAPLAAIHHRFGGNRNDNLSGGKAAMDTYMGGRRWRGRDFWGRW